MKFRKAGWRRWLALAAAAWVSHSLPAAAADGFADGIDRDDPNFVTASLLVMSPGEELFSCVGHAAIRLECPTFRLDYCFSYESEAVERRVWAFLAGDLKMGMFAIPTDRFLSQYRIDGRGARQYRLNLPPKAKQRLWKIMDDLAAQGANLPYDYLRRGCAKSVLDCIVKACAPAAVRGPTLEITQRETFNRELRDSHPWDLFCLNAIVGTETDTFVEVVTPKNLLNHLRRATVNGEAILTDVGSELVPETAKARSRALTPFAVSWLAVLLAALAFSPLRGGAGAKAARAMFLTVQALAGAGFVFLVSASHLPNSAWNWLLVPFNPLMPLLAAVARMAPCGGMAFGGEWATLAMAASAAVLIAWMAYMLLSPHQLTDPAYIVLAGAYALLYGGIAGERKILKIKEV